MKTNPDNRLQQPTAQQFRRFTLFLITALLVAACSRSQPTPTPAPAAPAATEATAVPEATAVSEEEAEEATSEEPASAPESPLAQPESPLSQPESPLTAVAPEPQSEEEAIALAAETTAPEPSEGNGSLSAVLWSTGIPQVIYGTSLYLTAADEVDGELVPPEVYFGPRPEMGDVGGRTNSAGQLFINDIPPGNYYMLVWSVYNWLSVFPSSDSGEPLLITIEEGEALDLGVLYADWP